MTSQPWKKKQLEYTYCPISQEVKANNEICSVNRI